jgi:hypothetical protein
VGEGESGDIGIVQLAAEFMHLLEVGHGVREGEAIEGNLAHHIVGIGEQLQGGGSQSAPALCHGGFKPSDDLCQLLHHGRVTVRVPDEPGELHRCPGRVDQGFEEGIVGLGEMLGGPGSMRHVFADGLKTFKRYVEDLGEAHDALLAVELALAELDLRHVFPGESPPLGEVLLGPAALLSEGSDEASERACR